MSARRKRALHSGLGFQDEYTGGPNIVYHREHRSKKGRNSHNLANSPVFNLYRQRKWELKNENDDDSLQ